MKEKWPFVALLHEQDRTQTSELPVTVLWKAFGVQSQKYTADPSPPNTYMANTHLA